MAEERETLTFKDAWQAILEGKKVRREGWSEWAKFVYLVPPAEYATQTAAAKETFGESVKYDAYIALAQQDSVAIWSPNTFDMMCNDWVIV